MRNSGCRSFVTSICSQGARELGNQRARLHCPSAECRGRKGNHCIGRRRGLLETQCLVRTRGNSKGKTAQQTLNEVWWEGSTHFVLGPAWWNPSSESTGAPGGHHRQRLQSLCCLSYSPNNPMCTTHSEMVNLLLLCSFFLSIYTLRYISKNPDLRSALFLGTGIF